mgnify:CR=1 FL=1
MVANSNLNTCIHIPPKYYGYKKEYFAPITKCTGCGAIALQADAHPVDPCKYCGNAVKRAGGGKWIPPVTRWNWFKREIITKGYWLLPTKDTHIYHETTN